ncbi:MAG: hypothetical protein ACYDIE_09770 [Candidatus Krumholzibacteriia bacterium]
MRRFLVLAAVACTVGLLGAPAARAADDLAAALTRAAADGKPVLIDFFTDW